MPTQNDMTLDTDLYRGVFEYDYQPVRYEPNPDYGKQGMGYQPYRLILPDGPVVVRTLVKGPYTATQPLKAFITRYRDRYDNLRLVRVEKVSEWTEVDL